MRGKREKVMNYDTRAFSHKTNCIFWLLMCHFQAHKVSRDCSSSGCGIRVNIPLRNGSWGSSFLPLSMIGLIGDISVRVSGDVI